MSSSANKGVNKLIRVYNGPVLSYSLSRVGLDYFYCKKKVLPEGIPTKPLNSVLRPVSDREKTI